MSIVHRIVGYDKRTELVAIERDVPSNRLGLVRRLANIPDADQDAVGSYPLDAAAVRSVSLQLGLDLRVEACDWFVEPFRADGT